MAWTQRKHKAHNRQKMRLDSISRRMLFTWFMLAGFIVFVAPERWTNKFQFTFVRMFSWPLKISGGLYLASPAQQTLMNQQSQEEISYQNYIADLEQQLIQAYQMVEKYSGIRNRRPLEGAGLMLADITTSFIGGTRAELFINRGTDDGLESGQYVLTHNNNSIIGIITDVDTRWARVKLFTDTTSSIPVKIAESEIKRMLEGIGYNSAKIKPQVPVTETNPVRVGDDVFALKTPGLLDVPMIIGRVTQFERDVTEPSVWDITVQPACDITKIEDVYVLIMNPKE